MRIRELLWLETIGLVVMCSLREAACNPFTLQYLFDVRLELGSPTAPIVIPGGVLVNEPILGGLISGPALNGTITGGLAYPSIFYNQTVQYPSIVAYGKTSDGNSINIQEMGVGTPQKQVTRIQLQVGGTQYASLAKEFVLASVVPNANRTSVHVKCYAAQVQ